MSRYKRRALILKILFTALAAVMALGICDAHSADHDQLPHDPG